jgi:hypothetical protein
MSMSTLAESDHVNKFRDSVNTADKSSTAIFMTASAKLGLKTRRQI